MWTKDKEESLLLGSEDAGPAEGPRMKAGGETAKNRGSSRDTKVTGGVEDRKKTTGQGKNGDLELEVENTRSYFKKKKRKNSRR